MSIAFYTLSGLYGLMDTTMFPLNMPLSLHSKLVLYIGTFFPSSICLTPTPSFISDSSNENEHPIKNVTKSSLHNSLISCLYSINCPFLYTLYAGRSDLISQPLGQNLGHSHDPGLSLISSRGQGLGFNSQNFQKSSAYSAGKITKFA
jgi:hypothetical protein